NAQWEGDRITFWLPDRAACCYILFRSRDGANDFTQITPIVAGSSFVDRDVRPGDTAFYQILQIDAGLYNPASGEVDVAVGSGEIIAHTPVFKAPIPPVDPPAVQAPTPPVAQQNIGNLPAKLQFGPNWI